MYFSFYLSLLAKAKIPDSQLNWWLNLGMSWSLEQFPSRAGYATGSVQNVQRVFEGVNPLASAAKESFGKDLSGASPQHQRPRQFV